MLNVGIFDSGAILCVKQPLLNSSFSFDYY